MNTLLYPSDSDLLRDYEKRGQQTAFSAIVERYQLMVVGTAFRKTGNFETARDVAQEVFAALARKAGLLIGRASLGGWLHQAAVYESLRTLQSEKRRTNRHERFIDESEKTTAPEVGGTSGPSRLAVLDDAIDVLPAGDREVLVLHYFQDLSYAEMAALLATNEPVVRKRVSRALERLGARLRERNVGGDIAGILAGVVAIQASLPLVPGLAQSALTAALAGAGSSSFHTLTAIMSHATVKLAAAIIALAAIPLLWHLAGPDFSTPNLAAAASSAAEKTRVRTRPLLRDPASLNHAAIAARDRLRSSWTLAQTSLPAAPMAATSGSTRPASGVAIPPVLASTVPSHPAIAAIGPAPPGGALSLPGAPIFPGPVGAPGLSSIDRDLLAVLGDLGFDGSPATIDGLRDLERDPPRIAAVYSDLLEAVLDLNPLQRARVEDFLQNHFESLNLKGLAGPPPLVIPELDWIASREPALTSVIEGVQAVIPEVVPAPQLLKSVFGLVEKPAMH